MRLFIPLASLFVLVSIACSGSRSAGTERLNNNAVQDQSTATSSANSSQEKQPCTLTLAAAPAIKRMRLGMTADEVLALFSGSKDDPAVKASLARKPNQFGENEFVIRPGNFESKEQFAGLTQIVFSLLDGRVASFYVAYNGPQYSHVDKFVEQISQESSLPPVNQWEGYPGMDTQLKRLNCSEFQVEVFIGGQGGNLNHVMIKDLNAEKTVNKRSEKANPQQSPTP